MTVEHLRDRLKQTGLAISALLAGIDDAESEWKPASERWSLREVAGHLHDEERYDFRPRLESLVDDPARPWPTTDPMEWVTARAYASTPILDHIAAWEHERVASLAWLGTLDAIDPTVAYSGPWPYERPLRAGDLMLSWVAHDCFHIRQISRLRWEYLDATGAPYSTRYAGSEE
ncbi:MAG: DinB family protein [Spirochaetaceae bacterium]|nr:MAG: DinB family protein [Spirochaetaceae bacterium]